MQVLPCHDIDASQCPPATHLQTWQGDSLQLSEWEWTCIICGRPQCIHWHTAFPRPAISTALAVSPKKHLHLIVNADHSEQTL